MSRRIPRRRFLATTAGSTLALTGCVHNSETDEPDTNESEDNDNQKEDRELTEEQIRQSLAVTPEHESRDAVTTFQYDLANSGANAEAVGPTDEVEVAWSLKTEREASYPPMIADGTVYWALDGSLHALDLETGEEEWLFETDGGLHSSPTVTDEIVYCGLEGTYAIDKKTGQEIWSNDLDGHPVILEDDVVYTQENGSIAQGYALHAVDAATGEDLWSQNIRNFQINVPCITDEYVVVAGSLTVVAVDKSTGNVKWEFVMKDTARIETSPTLGDGIVYIGGFHEHVHAIDAESGEKLWSWGDGFYSGPETSVEGEAPPSQSVRVSPVYHDGVLYFPTVKDGFYALDTETREPRWHRPELHGKQGSEGPLLAGDTIYTVVDQDETQHLYALDSETGETVFTYEEKGLLNAPAVAENKILIPGEDSLTVLE